MISLQAFGAAIATVGEKAKPMLHFFSALTFATMKVVEWIIYLAPIGIFSLIVGQILDMRDLGDSFGVLGWYLLTVTIGIVLHGLIVLPVIFGKTN